MIILRHNFVFRCINTNDVFLNSPQIDIAVVRLQFYKKLVYLICIYILPECPYEQVNVYFKNLNDWSLLEFLTDNCWEILIAHSTTILLEVSHWELFVIYIPCYFLLIFTVLHNKILF